ncbi:MAG: large subunit ribosomal protein L2 [Planctomycetota bacterium]|jgi:large subunit ribosomal protein L2
MAIRRFKPTSPGRRHGSVLDFRKEITCTSPEKSLLESQRRTGGRNSYGRMTTRRRGGGARQHYRLIDFKRNKDGIPAKVKTIEYDPNRTANIALLVYADGEKRYILAPKGLEVGRVVSNGPDAEPKVGNAMKLCDIPLGLDIHNVELEPGRGGQICRSAGTVARLMAREGNYATVVLPSGEMRRIHVQCRATIGAIGNSDHQHVSLGKAGRARHKGRRPKVRGTAQNPVAHPMGGGEGRSAGGRHPCSPTGVLAKGGRTRKRNKASNKFIMRRRKKRK